MIGKIIRINDYKRSFSNPNDIFRRVYFKVMNPDNKIVWAKTDLVPTFHNYRKWKDLLKKGNYLGNLSFKDEVTIDADCEPYLYKESESKPSDDVELKQQSIFTNK